MTTKRRSALAAVTLLAAGTMTACVGPPASHWEHSEKAECPVAPTQDTGKLRLGYLGSPGTDLYTYDQGLAEACMPNAAIEWTRFPTGQDIVQGFAAGSVDVAGLGSTPATKALSAPLNLDVEIPLVNSRIGETEALVAKHAETIADLRGKTIAVPFSSTAHYSLLKALIAAGLDPAKDVKITNISPDKLPAAWASDEIEATYVWDPALTNVKKTGHVLTSSAEVGQQGAPTYNLTMASRSWANDNGGLLKTWIALQEWVVAHSVEDPDGFVNANASQSGMSFSDTETQLRGQEFISGDKQASELGTVGKALYDTAVFLAQQGEIPAPESKEHYSAATRENGA